jgi:PAS domain S-box-containing protein
MWGQTDVNGVQARQALSSIAKDYALAVGFVAGALALTLPLRQFRQGPNVFLFFAAVMASSWFGGKGPGFEAVILSTLAVDYFLTPPLYSLSVDSADLAFFVSFILCAMAAGWVSARRRGAEQASAATTDQLKTRVTDRTAQLDKANEALRAEIAERKSTEEALRSAKEQLRFAQKASGSGVFDWNPGIDIATWSDEHYRLFGFEPGQTKPAWETFLECVHPDDRVRLESAVRDALKPTGELEVEYRIRRQDGQLRWMMSRGQTYCDTAGEPARMMGLTLDISERKEVEAELAKRTAQFDQLFDQHRTVVETATDAVVSIDESSQIIFVNPATEKLFGYAPSELIGQPLTMLMPEYMRELHKSGLRRYLNTRQRHANWGGIELTGLRKNGEEFPVEISFAEVIKNGRHIFTGFVRDITERKQAEDLRSVQTRQIALRADVSHVLAKQDNFSSVLQGCAEAMVRHLDAAFARIWTVNKDGNVLELQASAGIYTHLNGAHSRVPVGELKIGLIAQEKKAHTTNDVFNDPRISDKAWAKKEGMVAFAGYPLIVEDRAVGVFAMFSRQPIRPAALEALASVADSIAQGIQRKQAQEELREGERNLHRLTETIPQMLWSANADGAVDYCNQRMLDYTGLSADEIKGAGWMKVIHPNDVDGLARAWTSAALRGDPFQHEFRALRAADHAYRWCVSSGLSLRAQEGRVLKWYGSVVDLQDWKQAQEALQATQAELAHVTRLTTMGELVASIAHEINQPLTAIATNANVCSRLLASSTPDLVDLRGAVADIAKASVRASEVITRIRQLLKRGVPETARMDINDVIREVVALVQMEAHRKNTRVEADLLGDLPHTLGDRIQIQQVVLNLVLNGIDALQKATAGRKDLLIRTSRADHGDIMIEVRDSGPGIDPQNLERIFEPFFTTKKEGMGMGLAISRTIINAHGGTLSAMPNEDTGMTFRFTLPITS